jgi:hypothetical protein
MAMSRDIESAFEGFILLAKLRPFLPTGKVNNSRSLCHEEFATIWVDRNGHPVVEWAVHWNCVPDRPNSLASDNGMANAKREDVLETEAHYSSNQGPMK